MKYIIYLSILIYTCILPTMSFSQTNTIGNSLLPAGSGLTPNPTLSNPNAQQYLPETFTPTTTLPTTRERETIDQIQEKPRKIITPPVRPKYWGGVTFAAHYGQFEKLPYSDISISPYIILGPLFLSYDLPIRFSWNGVFITRMWTSTAALVSKIEANLFYEQTNTTFKNILISVYRGENLTLGHGRFFYDYNPNQFSPYEPFKTFQFSLDASYIGMNFYLANIAQPDLMGAELYIKPLAFLNNTYKDFKIYGVFGVDLDPFQSFSPGLYLFNPNPLSPTFMMFEVGLDVPVFATTNNIFAFNLYTDYSQFLPASQNNFQIRSGSGISAGFIATFAKVFPIRFEVSQAFDAWQPRWVNSFYYVDRPFAEFGGQTLQNKYQLISPNLTFYTTSFGFELIEQAVFTQIEVFGDFQGQDLWLTLSLTLGNKIVKALSLSVLLTMRDLLNENRVGGFLSPQNTIIELQLNYHMMDNMKWGLLFKSSGRVSESFDEQANPIISAVPFIFLGVDFSYRF